MLRILLAMCFFAISSYAEAQRSNNYLELDSQFVQLIIDNSGTLQNTDEAQKALQQIIYNLSQMSRNTDMKTSEIVAITVNKTSNIWRGNPKQLKNAKAFADSINSQPNGCSDIVAALNKAKKNMERKGVDESNIIIFSSMFHTGVPCKDTVKLSEAVPDELDLDFFLDKDVKFIVFWSHFSMAETWDEFFVQQGFTRNRFKILEEGETRSLLQSYD